MDSSGIVNVNLFLAFVSLLALLAFDPNPEVERWCVFFVVFDVGEDSLDFPKKSIMESLFFLLLDIALLLVFLSLEQFYKP